MDRLRVEYFADTRAVKVWVNAVLVQTILVDNALVVEAEIDWKTLRTMHNDGAPERTYGALPPSTK